MADWSNPTLTSTKTNALTEIKDRDTDTATMAESPTNPPTGYKRWVSASNKFQVWNGSAWVDLVLSVAGGGTGGSTQSAARTGLGLGTIATQNSNAIAITGGTISGLTTLGVLGNTTIAGQIIAGSSAVPVTDSAGQVLETAIADGSLLARNAANEGISGVWTFSNAVILGSNSPRVYFTELDAGSNAKNWLLVANGERFCLQTANDAVSTSDNVLEFQRSGATATLMTVVPNSYFVGQVRIGDGSVGAPGIAFASNPDTGLYVNTTNSIGISANGVLGLSVRETGGANTVIDPHDSKWAFSLIPSGDGSFDLGRSDLRWDKVYAVNGTIQTSDIRHKNNHGEIGTALDIVESLTPFIASWKSDNDGFKFPAVSAQEVAALVDSRLNTSIVVKDRVDCWSMNYTYLIPILIQAVKDLHAEVQEYRHV